jgi:hypothetical protein
MIEFFRAFYSLESGEKNFDISNYKNKKYHRREPVVLKKLGT